MQNQAPLTATQIRELADRYLRPYAQHWSDGNCDLEIEGVEEFARAIEVAHGVGTNNEDKNHGMV